MNEISELGKVLTIVFILAGTFLSIVTTIGLIRLPDLYTRTHAASKSSTLGTLFILIGAFIYFLDYTNHMNARLLLGIIFIFITGPVAGHLIGRAAYNTKVPLWQNSVHDDLNKDKHSTKQTQ